MLRLSLRRISKTHENFNLIEIADCCLINSITGGSRPINSKKSEILGKCHTPTNVSSIYAGASRSVSAILTFMG
jgi:hypothetical protein